MTRREWVIVVLLVALTGATVMGCERRVVGETYEGQLAGGRSLVVTDESPPRGATPVGAPATQPVSTRTGTVRETDPSTRGLLAGSGGRLVLHDPPRTPVIAPTPVVTVPVAPQVALPAQP